MYTCTSFTDWDRGIRMAHAGIKGMKWGRRKPEEQNGSSRGSGPGLQSGGGGGGSENQAEKDYRSFYDDLMEDLSKIHIQGASAELKEYIAKIPEDPSELSPEDYAHAMEMMGNLRAWVDSAFEKNKQIAKRALGSESLKHMEEFLAHHGIKGQKYGVRRFQRTDGSLTEAGRERYYGAKTNPDRDANAGRQSAAKEGAARKEYERKQQQEAETAKKKQAAADAKKEAMKAKSEQQQSKNKKQKAVASDSDTKKKGKGKKASKAKGSKITIAPKGVKNGGSRAKGSALNIGKYEKSSEVENKIKSLLRGGKK